MSHHHIKFDIELVLIDSKGTGGLLRKYAIFVVPYSLRLLWCKMAGLGLITGRAPNPRWPFRAA